MGKRGRLVVLLTALALAMPPGRAAAAASLPLTCASYADTTVCSGTVPSFDGSPLDVDLTLPAAGTRHPLVAMLHGFGNDKHEWESTNDVADAADKFQWNSHWFATHGFYVLSYTARGFHTSAAAHPWQPATPAASSASLPSGTIHLKSREFEIRDTQWLASQVAASHSDLDVGRVAVTGGSYGGGESWLQASQPVWSFPGLPTLRLRAAVPKYPWTDLGYSLAPNGHTGFEPGDPLYSSSSGHPGDAEAMGAPLGVPKLSYSSAFFAIGNEPQNLFENGTTTTPGQEAAQDGPMSAAAWFARSIGTGDPYDLGGAEDPVVRQLRRGLTVFRSSYYQLPAWQREVADGDEVAVFSISGWTDDLFPAVESFRQLKQLKALDPRWPVAVAVADIGHPRAQNPAGVWQALNARANQFLNAALAGKPDVAATVSSWPTVCGGAAASPGPITAPTPEGLAAGSLRIAFPAGALLTSAGGPADPDGAGTDPVTGFVAGTGGCRTSMAPAWPGRYTALSAPLGQDLTVAGIGSVQVAYVLTGGPDASLDARIWDVAPGGTATLLTRGAYRIDTPAYDAASGSIRVPLFGNHWALPAGHRLRLDLTQADVPTFRQSNAVSTLTLGPPTLVLPTVEPGTA
jgi:hypothetical protein